MLQHDRQLKFIAGNLEKKIKAELAKLMEQDREKYEKFYAAFGMQIKYGVLNDYGAKKRSFCRTCFSTGRTSRTSSSPSRNTWTPCPRSKSTSTLQAAKTGRDFLSCRSEKLGEKGFDVLLMTDEVDSFVPQTLGKYAGKGLPLCDPGGPRPFHRRRKGRSRRAG